MTTSTRRVPNPLSPQVLGDSHERKLPAIVTQVTPVNQFDRLLPHQRMLPKVFLLLIDAHGSDIHSSLLSLSTCNPRVPMEGGGRSGFQAPSVSV